MANHEKAENLKKQMASSGVVRCIGAHDALSARIGEDAGFDAIWGSGLGFSAVRGVPDANILGLQDTLEAARQANRAVKIPVVADCDIGFGDAGIVHHMVREFEAAGIAAVCCEDKVFPKLNSFAEGRQELAPIKEFVGKIAAAKEAQRTEGFQMFARVEALVAGWGTTAALERASAYADAGADAILIHSKSKNSDEIVEFIEQWSLDTPLVVVPTTYPMLDLTAIEALNKVGMVIYANHALRAGIRAMRDVLSVIYDTGSTVAVEDDIATVRDVFDLQDMPDFLTRQKRFTLPAQTAVPERAKALAV